MSMPVIGLSVHPPADPLLAQLLSVLRRWVNVRQADARDHVDAWVVNDLADPATIGSGCPVAVWTRDRDSAAARRWGSPAAWLVPGVSPPPGALSVPSPGIDSAGYVYMAPLLRQRWRERLGLSLDLVHVAAEDQPGGGPLAASCPWDTLLAVCASAIATGDEVLRCLAWGAPTVTDTATARQLRLNTEVLAVDDADHLGAAAHVLARDSRRCAELSWCGRRTFEESFDLATTAATVLEALEVPQVEGPGRVIERLTELRTASATAWAVVRSINPLGAGAE